MLFREIISPTHKTVGILQLEPGVKPVRIAKFRREVLREALKLAGDFDMDEVFISSLETEIGALLLFQSVDSKRGDVYLAACPLTDDAPELECD